MKFSEYLIEAIQFPKVWYHGSKNDFQKFEYKYMALPEGIMQNGPGAYLTTDKEEAERYGHGGYLKTIELKTRSGLRSPNSKYRPEFIGSLINEMPDKEDVLSNWDENANKAMIELKKSVLDGGNYFEVIQNVGGECYRNHEEEFIRKLKSRGIDGFVVDPYKTLSGGKIKDGAQKHLICYNPDILKIVKTEKL